MKPFKEMTSADAGRYMDEMIQRERDIVSINRAAFGAFRWRYKLDRLLGLAIRLLCWLFPRLRGQ